MQQYSDTIQSRSGDVISGATITVTNYPSGTTAITYATNAVGATTNPLTSDSNGQYSFYAPNGQYTLTFTKTGLTTATKIITLYQPSTILGASGTTVTCPADTTEDILATITVPANWMGSNGIIRVTFTGSFTGSTNQKNIRVRFGGIGGTAYAMSQAATGTLTGVNQMCAWQNNGTGAQVGFATPATGFSGGLAAMAATPGTGTVDTTVDTTIVITGQKALAGETLSLTSYFVELLNP